MREKLTEDGRPKNGEIFKPKLMIRSKPESGKVVIEIEDNGLGIPEKLKEKILKPFFFSRKRTQKIWLDLNITNDIIKDHGGDISLESVESAGATFVIKIPNDL